MSRWLRFMVDVTPVDKTSSWRVQVSLVTETGLSAVGPPRELERREDEYGFCFPVPSASELSGLDGTTCSFLRNVDPAALAKAQRDIAERRAGDMVEFGKYLFITLVGPDWESILTIAREADDRSVELALCWGPEDGALHRLHWEMMHSGEQFLAAGGSHHAAITRVVRDPTPATPRPIGFPPRVLFVVGASLHDWTIRPGAEMASLLRGLSTDVIGGRRILERVLQEATPRSIRAAVREFRPEVVHFICHGGVDTNNRGYLELQPDEGDSERRRDADQLLDYLRPEDGDEGLPAVAIVSACHTAATHATTRFTLGPQDSAPLAAQLVAGGIPIVVGMAGRVADRVARLFTVRFGEALLCGESLVRATAMARRVGYSDGTSPRATVDWAFPAVFVAPTVDADYRLVVVESADPTDTVNNWVTGYRLRQEPIFSGREEFIGAFHGLFRQPGGVSPQKQILAAWSSAESKMCGRSRLLKELAILAFREGHVPVLVRSEPTKSRRDQQMFIADIRRAVRLLRRVLDIRSASKSQLDLLSDPIDAALAHDELDIDVRDELDANQFMTPRAVSFALAADNRALLHDAQRRHPEIVQPNGQVVLLVDDLHIYGTTLRDFFDGVVSPHGAGDANNPVPVVVTFELDGAGEEFLKPIAEETQVSWVKALPIEPWRTGEDMLAYENVLMHPWISHDPEGIANTPWAFNDDAEEKFQKVFEEMFRVVLEGFPDRVSRGKKLYAVAKCAADPEYRVVVKADDASHLAEARG